MDGGRVGLKESGIEGEGNAKETEGNKVVDGSMC